MEVPVHLPTKTIEELAVAWSLRQHAIETNDSRGLAEVMRMIDDLLDNRPPAPQPVGVADDGELVYDDQSPWVQGQVTIAASAGGVAERIFTDEEAEALTRRFREDMGLEP